MNYGTIDFNDTLPASDLKSITFDAFPEDLGDTRSEASEEGSNLVACKIKEPADPALFPVPATELPRQIGEFAPYGFRFWAVMPDGTTKTSFIASELADRSKPVDLTLTEHAGEREQLECGLEFYESHLVSCAEEVMRHVFSRGLDTNHRKDGKKLKLKHAERFFKRMKSYRKLKGKHLMAGPLPVTEAGKSPEPEATLVVLDLALANNSKSLDGAATLIDFSKTSDVTSAEYLTSDEYLNSAEYLNSTEYLDSAEYFAIGNGTPSAECFAIGDETHSAEYFAIGNGTPSAECFAIGDETHSAECFAIGNGTPSAERSAICNGTSSAEYFAIGNGTSSAEYFATGNVSGYNFGVEHEMVLSLAEGDSQMEVDDMDACDEFMDLDEIEILQPGMDQEPFSSYVSPVVFASLSSPTVFTPPSQPSFFASPSKALVFTSPSQPAFLTSAFQPATPVSQPTFFTAASKALVFTPPSQPSFYTSGFQPATPLSQPSFTTPPSQPAVCSLSPQLSALTSAFRPSSFLRPSTLPQGGAIVDVQFAVSTSIAEEKHLNFSKVMKDPIPKREVEKIRCTETFNRNTLPDVQRHSIGRKTSRSYTKNRLLLLMIPRVNTKIARRIAKNPRQVRTLRGTVERFFDQSSAYIKYSQISTMMEEKAIGMKIFRMKRGEKGMKTSMKSSRKAAVKTDEPLKESTFYPAQIEERRSRLWRKRVNRHNPPNPNPRMNTQIARRIAKIPRQVSRTLRGMVKTFFDETSKTKRPLRPAYCLKGIKNHAHHGAKFGGHLPLGNMDELAHTLLGRTELEKAFQELAENLYIGLFGE